MRFGIGMNNDHTLEEVGKQFDVTRERISKLKLSFKKIKTPFKIRCAKKLLHE